MTLAEFRKKTKKLPDCPGVYFFLDKNKKVLYIGKAASLRDRVRSYFATDIAEVRSPLIAKIVKEARGIDWRRTDSVLEALFLEANLIKNYKPSGNTDQKDDKSWNYVVITKENSPRVLLVRGKELEKLRKNNPSGVRDFPAGKSLNSRAVALRNFSRGSFALYVFGPFPHGSQLKEALKVVRKIFPYRDTCTPNSGEQCFNAQLGLCPGVCSGGIAKKEYRRIIRHIALLFEGKKNQLMKLLEREMKAAARAEEFEKAAALRRQLFALRHVRDISLIKEEFKSWTSNARIEAYDVAHLYGVAAVGVVAVVENGMAQYRDYRTFRIRQAKAGDDTDALREVLTRRLGHDEWPLPRLVVVDGAAAHVNAARKVLEERGILIPVVGVVKDEKHRPRDIRGDRELIKDREREILLANAEAHRFAIQYHRRKIRNQQTERSQ